MYPIRLGFDEALARIRRLRKNKHYAEALVTSVFTFEKLMRRSIRCALLARGFTSAQARELVKNRGFYDLKDLWKIFDRKHQTLSEFIGNNEWQKVPKAIEMRNKLVHGERVYDRRQCSVYTRHVIKVLKIFHKRVRASYGIDPWATLPTRKKSKLGWRSAT